MRRDCFVWTPTQPLLSRTTPHLGPVRVCMWVLSWLGWAGRSPRRVLVRLMFSCGCSCCSLCLLHPPWAGVALPLFFSCVFCFFDFPSCAPPFSLAFRIFRPWVPWALASCGPPPSFVFLFFSPFFFLPPPACFFFCLLFFVVWVFFPFCFRPFFFLFAVPWCAGCALRGWCVLGCGACWCVLLWALCFGRGWCALALCHSVLPACASSFCVVGCCVARSWWRRAGALALPRAASGGCRVVLPAPRPSGTLRGFFFYCPSCAGCAHPPPSGCGVLCCALSCVVSCGNVVCVVFCVVPGVVCRACVGFSSCAMLLGVVSCWVVLCCFYCALLSCAAAFSAGSFFLRCSLPFLGAPGCFCFCALLVRCCAGVPASLLSVRCSLAPAALAGVLCCCLLCLRVCCWALCCVLGRCPSSSGPVPSGAVFCLVSPRCACFAVVCCCVVVFAAVLCAVCVLGCRAVCSLSSLPCAVLLCGPALPWCSAPLCCACWCCAAVWCCGVLSCRLVWFFAVFVWFLLLEEPLQIW